MKSLKHIKLYETFLDQLNSEAYNFINSWRKDIDDLMQSLIDDYGFYHLQTGMNSSVSKNDQRVVKSFGYASDDVFDNTDRKNMLIQEILTLDKKVKLLGLRVIIGYVGVVPRLPHNVNTMGISIEDFVAIVADNTIDRIAIDISEEEDLTDYD